ncbi:hypothetical protein NX02_09935 [Sphingomonas sanxanigenens DSM 19645 = NX02]|uniref:Uncharacterized protein n=2 Tax=Sphingomonas sanxanigenens TaxID=397260 RepID=W0AB44_9SPHN|nr:hypothetical protein NX02_09935 [Sphingomonas sanxanigenens DSM 19645 = NX02]
MEENMSAYTKTFAETYTMRSRFWQALGEIGKAMANAYAFDADLDNRAAIKELAWDAMVHSLIEHHDFKPEEL